MKTNDPQDVRRLVAQLDGLITRFSQRAEVCEDAGASHASAMWARAANELDAVVIGVRGYDHPEVPLPF